MSNELDISGSVILVADDNPNNLQVLESMLREFGCEVRIALDGEAALKSATTQLPDLILLDIHMPKLDGYDTCVQLKADERTRDIPVIFATAMTEEFNKVRGFQVGAVDYMTKPLQLEELRVRIGVHLDSARQRQALLEQTRELKIMNDGMMGRELRVLELKNWQLNLNVITTIIIPL